MARTLSIGIIGCGKIAHVDHVPNLLNVKGVTIAGLYDILPAKMRLMNDTFGLGAQAHTSLESLLAAPLDAVVVCTPNSLHYPQTLAALKAGRHVLCEKPMAATTPECTRMVNAAKKAGRVLHINQTLHYLPPYIALAELAAAGKIGDIRHIRCLRFHNATPDIGWSAGATWFVSKKYDGGIVLDIGVHMADMLKWIAGPVAEISALTDTLKPGIDVLDNARALLRFANGATGVLELSWTSATNGGFIEIYGSRGALRMGFAPDGKIELFRVSRRLPEPVVTFPEPTKRYCTSQQAFVDALLGKAPSPTPGELGRDAVALCEAIMKSGKTMKYVKVKRFD